MVTINKRITINAPVDQIFTYVSKPSNLPQIWPSLMKISNEKLLPNGRYVFQWVYKMAGVYLEGIGEYKDIVSNMWFIAKTRGAIESTMTWKFQPRGKGTQVILIIEYGTPSASLNQLSEAIVTKMNDQEADLILANLKARFMEPYVSR
jgi:uncharacterized membrane protein